MRSLIIKTKKKRKLTFNAFINLLTFEIMKTMAKATKTLDQLASKYSMGGIAPRSELYMFWDVDECGLFVNAPPSLL